MRFKKRQQTWDIDIYEFMIENYKSIPMFVDDGHPSQYSMYEIAKKHFHIMTFQTTLP